MNQIFKVYHIWKIDVYVEITGVEVATSVHLIEYCLDQLNNKHTKIAVNSAKQYFKGCSQKEIHLPQNGGPVKFLRN